MSYYLASAFGEVWMQPSGTVGLIGFATNALFLRDALDKAGIEAQFVARGEYKNDSRLIGVTKFATDVDVATSYANCHLNSGRNKKRNKTLI